LCEDLEAQLAELLTPGSFELERVDIDADTDLRARYDVRVPVLALGAHEICYHFLDLQALRHALASYNRESAANPDRTRT